MGKQTQQKPVSVKRGSVINRRANHTRDQDHQHSTPLWDDIGGGVLQLRADPRNRIQRNKDTNKWESVPKPKYDDGKISYFPPVLAVPEMGAQDIGG